MKKVYLLLVSILTIGAFSADAQCVSNYQYFINGTSVQFVDSSFVSSPSSTSYNWYFGDGNFGYGTNPSHNYTLPGNYYVCLEIYDSLAACYDSTCYTISITSGNPCNASFTYSVNNNTVAFTNSTGPAGTTFSYNWSFGDGVGTSSSTNPTYTYSSPGTYAVTLTAFAMGGSTCTYVDSITVTGNPPTPCNVSYTYSAGSNNSVNFVSNISPSSNYTYTWDFGDGTSPLNSNIPNATHYYTSGGSFIVSLTATNVSTGVTCSYADSIIVNYCFADFSYQVASNGTVNFTNLSTPTGAGVAYSWAFGDNNFSNAFSPSHTYSSSGTYNVTLSVFDTLTNCSAFYTDSLFVSIGGSNNCNASYTIVKDSSVAYGVILYNTSSNYGSHYYSWDFGDGTTGSGRTPIHQYQSFGSYLVCLTITDSILNCTSTFCDTVGMDTLGNLKSGFGLTVQNATVTSVEDVQNDLQALKLYPNPASNQITIDFGQSANTVAYTIKDITGKEVMVTTRSNKLERINLGGLEKGVYFMILNDGINQEVKKFIKN